MKEEIRILNLNDIDLMREVLEDDNMKFDKGHLSHFINTPNNYGFIVKLDNSIVGFAYVYELLRPDGKKMFYIHSVGLLQKYQNKGLGTKLLNYIINYAKENKCSEAFVITDKGNQRACHVYEKLGGKNDFENEIVYVYNFEKEN